MLHFLRSEDMLRAYHTLYKKSPEGYDTTEMSKQIKLRRNNVYHLLRGMCKKGFVERKGKIYTVIPVGNRQIMGIMKDNDDPRQAYREIDSLWENMLASFHMAQV